MINRWTTQHVYRDVDESVTLSPGGINLVYVVVDVTVGISCEQKKSRSLFLLFQDF
jgi:hypothetical protein